MPGDEMITVRPVHAGYTFDPPQYYWRHYYGAEEAVRDFAAFGGAPTETATPTPTPTATKTLSPTVTATATPPMLETPTPSTTPTPTATAGPSWRPMDSETTSDLMGVWGSSDHDVFAVGVNGTILHYDGSNWRRMESGADDYTISAVWGSSDHDVFAVGWDSQISTLILHYDGVRWRRMESEPWGYLNSLWGSSGNDVFAVGVNGIIHYDGERWHKMEGGGDDQFRRVWGRSPNDVFVTSWRILHYDGTFWQPMAVPLEWCGATTRVEFDYGAVWGSGNDLFIAGRCRQKFFQEYFVILHHDGAQWHSDSGLSPDRMWGCNVWQCIRG